MSKSWKSAKDELEVLQADDILSRQYIDDARAEQCTLFVAFSTLKARAKPRTRRRIVCLDRAGRPPVTKSSRSPFPARPSPFRPIAISFLAAITRVSFFIGINLTTARLPANIGPNTTLLLIPSATTAAIRRWFALWSRCGRSGVKQAIQNSDRLCDCFLPPA